MPGVCAVVVTLNRRELLRRSLTGIHGQTQGPDSVIVVDNGSTDGTEAMVAREWPAAAYVRMAANGGSSGGFQEGLRLAHAQDAEWIWLLDDDAIPDPDALAELLAAAELPEVQPLLLCSHVVWKDGRTHPMNFPTLERRRMGLVVRSAARGILPVRSATFVSLLVHRSVVDRFGLPDERFFIWSDDIEFTSRVVLGGGGAFLVPSSRVLHATAEPVDFMTAAPERFYYHVRNTLFIARAPGRPLRDRALRLWVLLVTVPPYLRSRPDQVALGAVIRGLWDGCRG